MKLGCYLLSLLRIHHPDCEHCNATLALAVWESDCGSLSNIVEYPNHLEHLLWAKHSFHALGTEIREGRLIQLSSAHPAALCQVIDNQVDELNLICS